MGDSGRSLVYFETYEPGAFVQSMPIRLPSNVPEFGGQARPRGTGQNSRDRPEFEGQARIQTGQNSRDRPGLEGQARIRGTGQNSGDRPGLEGQARIRGTGQVTEPRQTWVLGEDSQAPWDPRLSSFLGKSSRLQIWSRPCSPEIVVDGEGNVSGSEKGAGSCAEEVPMKRRLGREPAAHVQDASYAPRLSRYVVAYNGVL